MLKKIALATIMVATSVSCVTRKDIEEMKQLQKDMLAELKKGGRAAPARGQQAQGARPGRPDPAKTYAFPVGNAAVKGPKDAWVTIVEVSDFQCPYCKRVNPTIKQIEDTYKNDVRIAFKHNALPFHNRAKPAAKAAECANEQGKFWEMHDKMFENQRALEDAQLESYAKAIGVDMGRWKSCYASTKFDKQIDADQALANKLGARGTPAFFINGRYLSGAQPFDNFKRLIDEELKKAKASGISKADYYAKAIVAKGSKTL